MEANRRFIGHSLGGALHGSEGREIVFDMLIILLLHVERSMETRATGNTSIPHERLANALSPSPPPPPPSLFTWFAWQLFPTPTHSPPRCSLMLFNSESLTSLSLTRVSRPVASEIQRIIYPDKPAAKLSPGFISSPFSECEYFISCTFTSTEPS